MNSYITLQCDLKYLHNTFSEFYCLLDQPIILRGSFELGLTEFIYSNDFTILKEEYIDILYPPYIETIESGYPLDYTLENEIAIINAKGHKFAINKFVLRDKFIDKFEKYLEFDKTNTENLDCIQTYLDLTTFARDYCDELVKIKDFYSKIRCKRKDNRSVN